MDEQAEDDDFVYQPIPPESSRTLLLVDPAEYARLQAAESELQRLRERISDEAFGELAESILAAMDGTNGAVSWIDERLIGCRDCCLRPAVRAVIKRHFTDTTETKITNSHSDQEKG